MARLWQSGAELNSTTKEGTIASGSVSIDSTTKRTGSYSYKTNAAATIANFRYQWSVSNISQSMFYRIYFYISVLPNNEDVIFWCDRTQTDGVIGIYLETNGVLRLYNEAPVTPVQIGSDSSALNTAQWYRLELKVDNTTNASTVVNAYIDGVSFASGTVDTSNHGGQAIFGWGSRNSLTATYYIDDVGVNDTSGSSQTGLLGAGQIVHLQPNAAGDNNAFTVNVGGTAGQANNYTRVQEVTPDDATSYNADLIVNNLDDFKQTATPSSIASGDTINVVMVGVRFAGALAAGDATFKVRMKKASAGTVSTSGGITPSSTSWKTNQVVVPTNNYPLVLYQDPDAVNWTKATLDTSQIGYGISTGNTNAAQISTVWTSIDSTPVVASTATSSTLLLMGVG